MCFLKEARDVIFCVYCWCKNTEDIGSIQLLLNNLSCKKNNWNSYLPMIYIVTIAHKSENYYICTDIKCD